MEVRFVLIFLMLSLTGCRLPDSDTNKTTLPADFSHHRIFLAPVTESGDTLKFYTDTGGGANMIYESTVRRFGLQAEWIRAGDDSILVAPMPEFQASVSVPPPPDLGPFGDHLRVYSGERQGLGRDGFLGRLWFANRVWEFDYPKGSLSYITAADWEPEPGGVTVPLGFQVDTEGKPTTYFPRITVSVAGDTLDMLFDTGATAFPGNDAAEMLGVNDGSVIATSFIIERIYKQWRNKHPDWRVIEKGDIHTGMPMIEVPAVRIGSTEVGPVWFTVRADRNFTEVMSQWMDRQVVGALGGSGLYPFRVVVDYPGRRAVFYRER